MRSIYIPLLDLISLLKSGRFDLVGFLGGLGGELWDFGGGGELVMV